MISNGLMFGKDTHITLYLSTDFRNSKLNIMAFYYASHFFMPNFFSKILEIIDWIKFIEAFANFEVCTRLKLKWAVVKILAPDCLGGITLHIIDHDCNAFFVTMHSLFQKKIRRWNANLCSILFVEIVSFTSKTCPNPPFG